ncbi:hypothetical protein D1816_22950 [Aquimarina sp. AD10]|uniref:JmjC domain-containing protein n=1 Tax=Aquimarina aggregata TaxID=1642818 RepID=A0A163AJ83_9FLAO|nr:MULTISPECIES: hypothetical protein [Aquimarina]AXT63082.1 hypothetical protein D1816_22950 [Aquimarina sp. AD10]KZS40580.1 hypothetical protein AWE51_06435 [Aquimarina aggregata]RKM96883.1 hypothetical protein D7033_15325 [Aquimarina sp. AD10]
MDTLIEKEIKFNENWWDDFCLKNENFTKTSVIENALSDIDVKKLSIEVLNILKNMFEYNVNVEGFRFYLGDEEQNENYIKKNIFNNPPLENEDILAYSERVFKGEKFAIIMNFTEKYSNEMAKIIREKIDPLIQKKGYPLLGLDGTIFIGNYEYTPLGIHQDRRGENVIHFHLGPGDKIMYNWEDDVYAKYADSKPNNPNIEPLLQHAQKYQFKTGDVYYMPWNKWHVGYSGELSSAITLWFNNPTKQTYTEEMFKSFTLQYINEDDSILSLDSDTSNVKPLLAVENIQKDNTLFDVLNYVSEEYRLAILSNGGWSGLPTTLSLEKVFDLEEDYIMLKDKKISTPNFFKIYFTKYEDELTFFARGYKMEIKYHPELENIIKKLNTHEVCSVDSLIKDLSKDWPIEASLYFLALLYDKKAIEIIE